MQLVKRNLKRKSQPTFFFFFFFYGNSTRTHVGSLDAGSSLSYISGNIFIFFYEKVMNVIRS